MGFWRYLRDVLIVLAMLLVFSGLALGWWMFLIFAWLAASLTSLVLDYKARWGRGEGK